MNKLLKNELNRPARANAFLLLLLVALAIGCSPTTPPAGQPQVGQPQANGKTRTPCELKLLVVDDPALAAAIVRLRAEWNARTGDTLQVVEATSDALVQAAALPESADAVIYPTELLGTLATRSWIAALPANLASDKLLAWADTFELLQTTETAWNGRPYAVPFGTPVFTLYYRADLFKQLNKQPPNSWSELHELASQLAQRDKLGSAASPEGQPWHAIVQPLAAPWAGRLLLARAAAYARHRDHYSALFNVDTMDSLIAGPPFVRALEELIADARLGPDSQVEMNVDAARQTVLTGQAALALAWPGHASAKPSEETAAAAPAQMLVDIAELPGSTAVYNVRTQAWNKRTGDDVPQVTLLGPSGRLGSVTASAHDATAALELLAWLSGKEWGTRVASASAATTLFRRSQQREPAPWVDVGTSAEAAEHYVSGVRAALERPNALVALRIPGSSRYLSALDDAVRQAVRGEKSASTALQAAAEIWRGITVELGLDAQKQAYRQSLGLDAP